MLPVAAISAPILQENRLSAYIREVNSVPLLTEEEEKFLVNNYYEHRDSISAQRLIVSHLRLVVKIAFGFRHYGLPVSDLISEGNLGLMNAVKKFQPSKGFKLATYAMWWIKANIQSYILKSWSLVQIGTSSAQKKLFFNLSKIKNKLKAGSSGPLTHEESVEISRQLDVSTYDIADLESVNSSNSISLNDLVGDGEDKVERLSTIASAEQSSEDFSSNLEETQKKKAILSNALKLLNQRELEIFMARKVQQPSITLDVLSKKYSISKERVRQIEEAAMSKLQTSARKLYLDG